MSLLLIISVTSKAASWPESPLPNLQVHWTNISRVFIVTFIVFIAGHQKLIKVPASGSPILEASHTIAIAVKERGFNKATRTALTANGRLEKYKFAMTERYTDSYVAGIWSAVKACKYFVLFPFYFVVWVQSYSNLVAQAASMDNGSTPNDLMQSIQMIFMLAFIPMLDRESLSPKTFTNPVRILGVF